MLHYYRSLADVTQQVSQALLALVMVLAFLSFTAYAEIQMFDWQAFWHFNASNKDSEKEDDEEDE